MPFPFVADQKTRTSRRLFSSGAVRAATTCIAMVFSVVLLFPTRTSSDFILISGAILVLGALTSLHVRSLFQVRFLKARESVTGRDAFFDRALEAILILDEELICRAANPAAARLLGIEHSRLTGRSISDFSPQANEPSLLSSLLEDHPNRGTVALMRPDGTSIQAQFSSSPSSLPGRHLLMLYDQTALVRAEEAKRRSLTAARSSMVEAYVLHSATVALARTDPLNVTLDHLLEILHSVIPYEFGQILLLEGPNQLFSARKRSWTGEEQPAVSFDVLDLDAFPTLRQMLEERRSILVQDRQAANDRCNPPWNFAAGTWLGVPLYAGEEALGLLSLAHSRASRFMPEHLRLAGNLAAPLSLAVHNSRLYEQAQIFQAELVQRLSERPPS